MSRREFIAGTVAAAALGATGCSSEGPEDVIDPCPGEVIGTESDIRLFESFRDLARLEYFDIDCNGQLRCIADFPPAVDIHVHLGFTFSSSAPVDLQASHDRVLYYFDCDEPGAACPIDLDLYANLSIDEATVERGKQALFEAMLGGENLRFRHTHTIPNLLAEMDRFGVGKSVILPIAMNTDYDLDNESSGWAQAISNAGAQDRLISYCSVHPDDPAAISKLEGFIAAGTQGLKIHPSMQFTYPDSDEAMGLYSICSDAGIPVLFHSGRTGLEVAGQDRYVSLDRYEGPVRDFPNVNFVFGHSGAVFDADATLELARECENVWLCLAGPSIPQLEIFIEELGPDRLLYGTDWPFYTQAMQMAKILIATRSDRTVRNMIMSQNGERFLNL